MEKASILFLLPGPIYRPNLHNFRDKYIMLSKKLKGSIYTWTSMKQPANCKIGDFFFNSIKRESGGLGTKLMLAGFIIAHSVIRRLRGDKYELVVCYDPLFTGIIGVMLKYIFQCRLIIEINGNLLEAGFLGKN